MRPRSAKFACVVFLVCLGARPARAHTVTFNNQVVRIFQQHCQTCHRPGNVAPFSLLTYAEARSHAFEILRAVESRKMPPWKPVNSKGVFEGERSLSDDEIQTISEWVSEGVEEGSPDDLPEPITFPEDWGAGRPDVVVQPGTPYSVQAGSADIYRCFPIDVGSQSGLNVRGYEVLPGNRTIVHHVLLFIDEAGQSAALDNADPGPGYTCFGGAGFVIGLGALGGWVPGATPQIFPLGTGVRIPAGARIVMQVHYSTAEAAKTSSGPLDPDLTRLGLYLSPSTLQSISFLPVVNPLFAIPPGDSRHEVRAFLPILSTVELVAIAPHMHLLGRDVTVEAIFPNLQRRQLIHIDDWDFHWQGSYAYREPIILPAGTMIEMTAHYDNSVNNPKNPANPPVTVRWGERTVDEMCLTFIAVKTPGIPSLNTVPYSITDRGTSSVVTQGTSTAIQVGHARVSDSSGAAPQGLAIFGYRQNGVLITEAAVPASRLLARGRIYAETSSTVRSGLAIANPNGQAAAVSFTFTDESGRDVTTGSASIPANGQIAAFLDEPPFNGARSFSGSFTFSASPPVAAVALRGVVNERSELLLTTLPVADVSPPATTSGPAVFPHFADGGGWTTRIMLVNPGDNAISGVLRFSNPSGQTLSTLEYSIPGRSARQLSTPGTAETVSAGPVWIAPSANSATPTGSLVFTYRRGGIRTTEAGVPLSTAGTAFRVYVEVLESIQPGLAIANASSSTATVRLELIDLNGASVAGTSLTLAANAQLAAFLNQIPGLQTLSLPFRGLLRITSSAPVAITGLRSRNNERGDFLITTTPPVPESSSSSAPELFFPHFADAGGYTTQFILFTAGTGRPVSGTIRFLSQSGEPLDLKLR